MRMFLSNSSMCSRMNGSSMIAALCVCVCVVCACVCISILKYACLIGPSHSPSHSPVCTQNLLKLHNVIILICTDQTGHGFDLGIVLVGFGLGRSEVTI